jgi:hypothetical protein
VAETRPSGTATTACTPDPRVRQAVEARLLKYLRGGDAARRGG